MSFSAVKAKILSGRPKFLLNKGEAIIKPKEKDIENSILQWLTLSNIGYFFKVNTTGVYDPVNKTFRRNMNKYAIAGVSDILGVVDGRFVAIEVKTPTGRASDKQKIFLQKIEGEGGFSMVARSVDDVIAQFRLWNLVQDFAVDES